MVISGFKKHAKGSLMSSNDIAINIENLSKCFQIYDKPRDRLLQMLSRGRKQYYREFWALNDVSFEVKKGETVGIIGSNGSGKSTLLQIICGTLTPTSGVVETKGRIAALLELGSGFNPEFTGIENIYLNAAVLGLDKESIDACFEDIIAFADIGEFIAQPVKSYSSGMVVRLAFAVQSMIDPDILVVDEALAVGDEKFQRKCFSRLEELKDNGTAILFVSHSGPQIVELCDRAMLLNRGKRLLYTKPAETVRAYQRLIYSPIDEQSRLINKYQSLDHLGDGVSDAAASSATTSIESVEDGYDPSLKPETTTVYPVQGAEISSFRILDAENNSVNILKPGHNYRFEMTGKFLEDCQAVYFGLHVRSVSGAVITGQRFPEEGEFIDRTVTGEHFSVKFSFSSIFLPGVYFMGGGVWSCGEQDCLHRILDSIMFRVTSDQKSYSFGYINASTDEPTVELF